MSQSSSNNNLAGPWDQSLFNRTSLPKQIADVWAPTSPAMTRFNPATKAFSPMTNSSSSPSTASFDEHRRNLNKRHQQSNITNHANANSLPYQSYATKNTTHQHEQLSLPSRGNKTNKAQRRSRPSRQTLDFQEFHQQFPKRQAPHFQNHQQLPEFMNLNEPQFTTQAMPADYLFLPRYLPVLYA
eukprot:m.258428 g.258428  ORF g.258428 m.258428 type:complete len:185 (-) comp36566_c0_seq1:135-689(-)